MADPSDTGILGLLGRWDDPAALYTGALSDPATRQAIQGRGLLALAGSFADSAMPTRMPTPIGAVLGHAAAALGTNQDQLMEARLRAAQSQQALAQSQLTQSHVDFLKTLPDALRGYYGPDSRGAAAPTPIPGTITPGSGTTGGAGDYGAFTKDQIDAIAQKYNQDPALVNTTLAIESSHGTNTGNTVSPSNTGAFQMAPHNAPGGAGDTLENQLDLGTALLSREKADLEQRLGRPATNAEVYLAHQQGAAGAAALLNNPDKPAGQVTRPINITNNGGDPNAPASAFVQKVTDLYARKSAPYAAAGAAAQVAAAPAQTPVSGLLNMPDNIAGRMNAPIGAPALAPAAAPQAAAAPTNLPPGLLGPALAAAQQRNAVPGAGLGPALGQVADASGRVIPIPPAAAPQAAAPGPVPQAPAPSLIAGGAIRPPTAPAALPMPQLPGPPQPLIQPPAPAPAVPPIVQPAAPASAATVGRPGPPTVPQLGPQIPGAPSPQKIRQAQIIAMGMMMHGMPVPPDIAETAKFGLIGPEAAARAAATYPFDIGKATAPQLTRGEQARITAGDELINIPGLGWIQRKNLPGYTIAGAAGTPSGMGTPGGPAPSAAAGAPGGVMFPSETPAQAEIFKANMAAAEKQLEPMRADKLSMPLQIGNSEAIASLMNRTQFGWGANTKNEAAMIMEGLGVPADRVKQFTGIDTAAGGALNKLFLQFSADAVRTMGAREPGSVISMFKNAYPNLESDPNAANLMNNYLRMQAQWKFDRANAAEAWNRNQQQNAGSFGENYRGLEGFDKSFDQTNSPEYYFRAAAAMSGDTKLAWANTSDADKQRIYDLIPPGRTWVGGDGKYYPAKPRAL